LGGGWSGSTSLRRSRSSVNSGSVYRVGCNSRPPVVGVDAAHLTSTFGTALSITCPWRFASTRLCGALSPTTSNIRAICCWLCRTSGAALCADRGNPPDETAARKSRGWIPRWATQSVRTEHLLEMGVGFHLWWRVNSAHVRSPTSAGVATAQASYYCMSVHNEHATNVYQCRILNRPGGD
jgi:hypothetical protein